MGMAIGTCAAGSQIPCRTARAREWGPPTPRRGIPAIPTPGVPKDRAAMQKGGGWDARPVGMALGTCAEGTRIPGQPTAAHARVWQTGPRMVRQRAGKLGAGPTRCGGAVRNVRRAPAGGARPCDRGDPYHPDGASRQVPPRGFQRTERHCKRQEPGCASRGHGDRDLRSGVLNPLPACSCAVVAPPNTPMGHPGNPNPEGSKGPSDVANWGGAPGCTHICSAPEGGPRPCDRGAPYHPGGASLQAPPRGFQRTERHCKRAVGGMRIPCAMGSGPALRGPESWAALPLRMGGRTTSRAARRTQGRQRARKHRARPPCWDEGEQHARVRASAMRQRPTLPSRRGIPISPTPGVPKDRAALQTGGWRDARQVCSAPAHGPGLRGGGTPYHPDGASRIAPPWGFQSTERHCKWAGDGMRVPWAWRSGLVRRGPESLANPPLCTPGRGRPAHAWSDRGPGSSA
ncbi:hypothetical protein COCNU_scaffold017140G000010 [Cocos nucifera]|nr:hypothetical protein [Cocos nucifera]